MTKKETKPKEKPESPKLRDERHHSFPPEKNKEKEKIFFAGKSARGAAFFIFVRGGKTARASPAGITLCCPLFQELSYKD
ncbi:hypothetical protein TNCV_3904811 [Trichonephila clavipes]|nr:hypothetical protein TNCV_3904811 [Trichonephila clavipes]